CAFLSWVGLPRPWLCQPAGPYLPPGSGPAPAVRQAAHFRSFAGAEKPFHGFPAVARRPSPQQDVLVDFCTAAYTAATSLIRVSVIWCNVCLVRCASARNLRVRST